MHLHMTSIQLHTWKTQLRHLHIGRSQISRYAEHKQEFRTKPAIIITSVCGMTLIMAEHPRRHIQRSAIIAPTLAIISCVQLS